MASSSSSLYTSLSIQSTPFPSSRRLNLAFFSQTSCSSCLPGSAKRHRLALLICSHHHELRTPDLPSNPLTANFLKSFGVSTIFLALGFAFACSAFPSRALALVSDYDAAAATLQHQQEPEGDETIQASQSQIQGHPNEGARGYGPARKEEDKELQEAFEKWKSKSYSLTVPLTVVALRGSVPPSWVKDFVQSQGRRLSLKFKQSENLERIFSDLSTTFSKGNVKHSSTVAADVVSIGDSWLSFAIKEAVIEPIPGAEDQDWFKSLSDKWKVYLCRNFAGDIDPKGKIWAAPYRWGSMVIAYKKSTFEELNMDGIEDWADLWRPELEARIAMVNCPREVIGAVLKYMGASYNTSNIDTEVVGGKKAVQQNLELLAKQVRLFDSSNYLKAFGVGDVWVAVGWSNDVIPTVKRMRNVTVVVPKSGASLWTDLWAIPAASRLETDQIRGRVRGPSPLIHQWIEFCLQSARALPFVQDVVPGAIASAIEGVLPLQPPQDLAEGKQQPKLDTNLVAGAVPPLEILSRCEFLEPLSVDAVDDYKSLIAGIQRPNHGLVEHLRSSFLRMKLRVQLRGRKTVKASTGRGTL